ncbi:AraC family transcriptional regulator [Cohnella sp. GCM10020058]|uniref:AraC family transcriptional regulator n=1 Tax=Cohnella sp. GCM10020058 TaxID=3317330 RepID=UPI00362D6979
MRLNRIRRNGKLYVRILLGLTLSIVLVLIASNFIFYLIFTGVMQDEAVENDLANLQQTGKAVANTTESAQTVAFQIYRNSAITKMLYYSKPDAFDTQAAMLDLRNYLSTMPFIQSIYVYNPASGYYYIAAQNGQEGIWRESEVQDAGILDILGRYRDYKPFTPIPRTIKSASANAPDLGVYTYLCYDAINFNREINSAVIVNLSASWINRELGKAETASAGRTYLLDDHDVVRSVDNLMSVKLGPPDLALLQSFVAKPESGFAVAEFEGAKSLITYTAPTPYEWHYVRIMPYGEITHKTKDIRGKTLQVAGAILAVGLLLSWLMSRYLYVPINRIERRMSDLESEKRNSSYTLRQNTLRKLIQIQDFDPAFQLEKLRSAGIAFDFTEPYQLAFLRIDGFDRIRSQSAKDLLTYKFAIMNIAAEISSKLYGADTVDLEDDGILMLINAGGQEQDEAALLAMLKEIQDACAEFLRIGLTISLTPATKSPHELHAMYKLAREATDRRFFRGCGAVIQAAPGSGDRYAFSVGKEKKMLDALVAGKAEEAAVLYRDILLETADSPFSVTQSAANHVAVTLGNMLAEIERNGSLQLGIGADLSIPGIDQYETLDGLTEAMGRFFGQLSAKVFEKRSNKQEDLIRKINALIETRYGDSNLSLNSISEELKMSTYHVSRVYRQHTFTTIVDMINNVRIERAKAILMSSDDPVAEVAERTGFTNSSYFHRMFKKLTGVTPVEFRKAQGGSVQADL